MDQNMQGQGFMIGWMLVGVVGYHLYVRIRGLLYAGQREYRRTVADIRRTRALMTKEARDRNWQRNKMYRARINASRREHHNVSSQDQDSDNEWGEQSRTARHQYQGAKVGGNVVMEGSEGDPNRRTFHVHSEDPDKERWDKIMEVFSSLVAEEKQGKESESNDKEEEEKGKKREEGGSNVTRNGWGDPRADEIIIRGRQDIRTDPWDYTKGYNNPEWKGYSKPKITTVLEYQPMSQGQNICKDCREEELKEESEQDSEEECEKEPGTNQCGCGNKCISSNGKRDGGEEMEEEKEKEKGEKEKRDESIRGNWCMIENAERTYPKLEDE